MREAFFPQHLRHHRSGPRLDSRNETSNVPPSSPMTAGPFALSTHCQRHGARPGHKRQNGATGRESPTSHDQPNHFSATTDHMSCRVF